MYFTLKIDQIYQKDRVHLHLINFIIDKTISTWLTILESSLTYFTFDLFDLRALAPLDLEPIRESLARTHRLAVIHEGRGRAGFGAELVTQLVEKQFFDLEAPPLRITSMDTPVPFAAELEAVYRPGVERITEQLIEWME